jgi:ZIP family zinc transporter
MLNFFTQLSPIWQALIATTFTWLVTALGAATVFLFTQVNRKLLDGMLGFAAGVMIAASYWSLLAPAIEMSRETSSEPVWVPAAVGFLSGGAFIRMIDLVLPHLHLGFPVSEAEGVRTKWRRSILLVLAITLHNFPEGLAGGARESSSLVSAESSISWPRSRTRMASGKYSCNRLEQICP